MILVFREFYKMADLQTSTVEDTDILNNFEMSGNFSRPNLPLICVSKDNGGGCFSSGGPVPFNKVIVDNGTISRSNNNSRFTVPENGAYFVHFWTIGHNNCGSTGRIHLRVNGSRTSQARSDSSIRYGNAFAYRLFDLSAGDYLDVELGAGAMYFNFVGYNRFTIYKAL